jgi:hypothetical protein
VAEGGFACPELDKLLESEPLDRWSSDGYLVPAERGDLLRQERAWRVDLNLLRRLGAYTPHISK